MSLSCAVTYKSGYYKKIKYKLTGSEMPLQERPDYWVIAGWTNTVEKLHLNIDVAFFGNSLTYGSHFEEDFVSDSLNIINLGCPGDNIQGMIRRMDLLTKANPKKVFLMAGINGLKQQNIKDFENDYSNLIMAVKKSLPASKIYLQSVLPVNPNMVSGGNVADNDKIVKANKTIMTLANRFGCQYVDLYSLYVKDGALPEELTKDGLHLKKECYDRWAKAIHPLVLE